jgi:hypothetical protein
MDEIPISRRKLLGAGIATGLALATGPTRSTLAKPLAESEWSPEFRAAFDFANKKTYKSGRGYWAVAYLDNNFAGEPVLIGNPQLMPKPQDGAMPAGWGSKTGSIVVGPATVLRLIHSVNGQATHVTLLPWESMAKVGDLYIADGQCSWKLYPAGNLRPPY